MKVEYKKDLRHNYMIITKDSGGEEEAYCIKMLKAEGLEGVLSLEQRSIDNQITYYYDITSKQAINNIFEKTALTYDRLQKLFLSMAETIEKTYEYLLNENSFVISPEMIYMDLTSDEVYLCYLPGFQTDIKEQMSTLMEYFMNKVNYNDKEAVLLVYNLYSVGKEEGFTFDHLIRILKSDNHTLESHKHKSPNTEWKDETIKNIDDTQGFVNLNETTRSKSDTALASKQRRGSEAQFVSQQKPGSEIQDSSRQKPISGIQHPLKQKLGNVRQLLPKPKSCREIQPQLKSNSMNRVKTNMSQPPIMMEKVTSEQDIPCYPWTTYLYTAISGVALFILVQISVKEKLIYTSLGNRIDLSKLVAFVLILFCIEGYLLTIIWGKKRRISKIITKQEYMDPRSDTVLSYSPKKEMKWKKDYDDNMTTVKRYEVIESTPEPGPEPGPESKLEPELESEPAGRLHGQISTQEEVSNPTCLLSTEETPAYCYLKPTDETIYETIAVDSFPFFIGKLKKNVDYCLKKEVVSRYHAKITKEQDQFYITDLNSTNGTFVNKTAIPTYQPKEVVEGDEIAFANIRYRFMIYENENQTSGEWLSTSVI